MAIDPDVADRLKPIEETVNDLAARLAAVDPAIAALRDALADFDARLDALEAGGVVVPPPPAPALEFRRPADFTDAELRENEWPTGPHTLTDPALVEYHPDGTATLHAEQRPDQPGWEGRTYYCGSLVTRTDFAKGVHGAIVHFIGRAVAAVFSYGPSGKEVDFELTYLLGQAGWSPNLWMPKQGGGRYSAGSTAKRIFRRAPLHDGPQKLLMDLRDDRADFYYQNLNADLTPAGPLVLFETITAADFPADVIWDVTTEDLALVTSIEYHGTWAGWGAEDYAQPASMRVYGITPTGTDVALTAEPVDDTPPALDASARTIDGIAWTFAASGGAAAGVMEDGRTIALARAPDGTGSNTASATIVTKPGVPHRLHFSTRGQISVEIADVWKGHGSGNHVRAWTPTGASEVVRFTNNSGVLRYLGAVRLEVDAVVVPPPSGEVLNPSVGTGLEGVVDWSTEQPFADALKLSSRWQGASASAIRDASDADGHLLRMPAGTSSVTTYLLTELPPAMKSVAGRYRLRWTGKGEVQVGGQTITATGPGEAWISYTPTGGNWPLRLTRIDPADPIRLRDMVHEANIASYDAGDIFNPNFIRRVENMRVLRFMDWQRTNASMEVRWAERFKPSHRTYTGWPGETPGVPLEVQIDLCNRVGADGWFNVPHMADDDYVEQMAKTIRARLRPDLKAHIEYTNESWNYAYAFTQTYWVRDQATARWPGLNVESARSQWGAGRTVQIARIFERVFGAAERHRYRIVLGGHTVNTWLARQALLGREWMAWDKATGGDGRPVSDFVDAYAIAGYFGYGLSNSGALATTLRDQGVAAAVSQAIGILETQVEGLVRSYADNKAVADEFGLALVMYEGGMHSNPTGGRENDPAYLDMLFRVHRDPRLGPIYKRWLDIWRDAGGQEMCLFVAVGRWTKHGMWGHLEHLDDQSARWDAITEWNKANPAGWETRPTGTFIGRA